MKYFRGALMLSMIALSMFAAGCGGGGSSSTTNTTTNQPIATSGKNIAAISVNGGPDENYANGVFVSVTVCVPSTSTCQTVPNVLVDTGSTGLRILSSALTISLTQQNGSNGAVAECYPFLSGFT